MGKLKQAIMAKTMDDQGPDLYPDLNLGVGVVEPREPGFPDDPDEKPSDEDLAVGFAMQELTNAIKVLKQYKPYSEYSEIDKAQSDLAELIADMDKPS